jgi:hypothetical protein
MDDIALKLALVSGSREGWCKTAGVLSRAFGRLKSGPTPAWWPDGDGADARVCDALHEQLDALVDGGVLLARGNIWWPHHSEVRCVCNPRRILAHGVHDPLPPQRGKIHLDGLLLTHVDARWQKVARLVSRVMEDVGYPKDARSQVWSEQAAITLWEDVTERIEALVARGLLQVQGHPCRPNTSLIRFLGTEAARLRLTQVRLVGAGEDLRLVGEAAARPLARNRLPGPALWDNWVGRKPMKAPLQQPLPWRRSAVI